MFPKHGSLEITTAICPFNCRFCPQRLLELAYDGKQSLSLPKFRSYLKKIPKYVRIDFGGFSEPFTNSKCINMIEHAHKQGYELVLFTTLVGVSEKEIEKLTVIPFTMFCVHLPDLGGNGFEVPNGWLEILKKIIEVENENWNLSFMSMGVVDPMVKEIIGERGIDDYICDRAGNLGWPIPNKILNRRVRCSISRFDQNVMLPNGDVVLCCMDYGMEHKIGSLETDTWETLNREKIKRMSNERNSELLCRSCRRAKNV